MSDGTIWDRLADTVVRRPGRTLVLALVPLLGLAAVLPFLETTHDVLGTLPPDSESVQGFEALHRHMPVGETAPLVVILDHDEDLLDPAPLGTLADLSIALRQLPGVSAVRSAALPTGGAPPHLGRGDRAADLAELRDGLEEAAEAAGALADGAVELHDVLAQLEAGLAELAAGLGEAEAGAEALRAGAAEAVGGVGDLRRGLAELSAGLAEGQEGVGELRREVAEPAEDAIRRAAEAIDGFTVGQADPRFPEAAEAVGEAHALITGRHPPFAPNAGERVDPDYDGLATALGDVEQGLVEARDGVARLDEGLAQLEAGLAEAAAGLAELAAGLDDARGGAAELRDGAGALREAVAAELVPGTHELAAGLREGADDLGDADLEALEALEAGEDGRFVVTTALLEAEPGLRAELARFMGPDGTRTRMFVTLAHSPFADEGVVAAREIEQTVRRGLVDSPLGDAEVLLTGTAVFLGEVDDAASRDFPIIVGAVVLGVFAVLVLLLRSVVVPAYMVATVLLTYAAALGATAIVFQGILGRPGIQWWIPPMLFVMLVVLGVDYSIFLMGRVREEAASLVTRDAIAEGLRRTGQVITSAGLILAGTFAALLVAPLRSLAEIGFAAMVGILLDTFVVRALLVPSVATLLGRYNWWPSARARAA